MMVMMIMKQVNLQNVMHTILTNKVWFCASMSVCVCVCVCVDNNDEHIDELIKLERKKRAKAYKVTKS